MSDKIQPYVSSEEVSVDVLIPRALVTQTQNLISILSEYYSWMSQEGGSSYDLGNLHRFRDASIGVDEFLSALGEELGHGVDTKLIGAKTNIFKHLKEIYVSKGTRDSVELIFKLLFNDSNVRIHLPKEQILKASDGRWQQDVSIFVELETGVVIDDLYGEAFDLVDVTNNATSLNIALLKHNTVDEQQGIYELFVTRNFIKTPSAVVGLYRDDNRLATTLMTTNDYEIIVPGTNFYPGYTFVATTELGSGLVGKVTHVSAVGAIEQLSFMMYGVGYVNNEIINIVPSSRSNIQAQTNFFISGPDTTITHDDVLGGFREDVNLYVDSYSDGTYHTGFYSGILTLSEGDDRTYSTVVTAYDPNTLASIKLLTTNTVVNKYGGYFKDNRGFLSDDMKLQDNYYYQNFSYVIQAEHARDTYYDHVLKNTHTAGMVFFSEYKKSDNLLGITPSLTTQVIDTTT